MSAQAPFTPYHMSMRKRLAFLAFIVVSCYLLAELGAWLYLRNHPVPIAPYPVDDQILGIYDPATAERVAADLRHRTACFLPYLQIGLVPNQKHASFTINSFGYRGKAPELPKPEGVYRIIMLGGSTLWGEWCSSDNTTIPAFLERELAGSIPDKTVEVFNCGMPGYVSAQEFLQYALYLHAWHSDLIIVFDGFNDIYTYYNTGKIGQTNWMGVFNNAVETARLKNAGHYNPWRDTVRHFLGKSFLVQALHQAADEPTPPRRRINDAPQKLSELAAWYAQNLANLARSCANDNAQLVVVLQPILPLSGKKIAPSEQLELAKHERLYENFKDFTPQACTALWAALQQLDSKHNNLTALSALHWLDSHEHAVFFDLCHFSDEANASIAKHLAEELRKSSILSR